MIKVHSSFNSVEYQDWAWENIYDFKKTKRSIKLIDSVKKIISDSHISKNLKVKCSNDDFIKLLFIGNPDDIPSNETYKELNHPENNRISKLGNAYKEEYDKLRSNFGRIIATKLKFRACPYCNRNFTFSVEGDKIIATFQLDHILPKQKFPFLALNIHNLVPVCSTCNLTKSTSSQNINPFREDWNNIKFKWKHKVTQDTSIIPHSTDEMEVYIEHDKTTDHGKKVSDTCKTLGIDNLYGYHAEEALEIIKIAENYNKTYLAQLAKKLKTTETQIKRDLLGPNLNPGEFHKRPLAKFTRDIAEYTEFLDPDEKL